MQLMAQITKDKLRGGFYTPAPIAKFILEWALNGSENSDILEPSCGDGIFLEYLKNKNFNSVTAIEIDNEEAQKASQVPLKDLNIINKDFHEYCNDTERKFDIIVGNPPYIRYQYFSKRQQKEAQMLFIKAGLKYTKLMNAWVSFVVGSSLLLKKQGKIGFVLPAEILQVSYAKELRKFLAQFFNKISIISFKKLVFPSIQQEIVLLLCQKNNSNNHTIDHFELDDTEGLKTLNLHEIKNPKKQIDFKSNKWTFYFLEQEEIDFLQYLLTTNALPTMGDFSKVEVGMTTGANSFFTVTQNIVDKYDLQEYARPMVGKSVQVKSVVFSNEDWLDNLQKGAKANFLKFPKISNINGNHNALQYIKKGEDLGIHQGYKCRIRDEWQIVPSTKVSDALFIRRNNLYPRLIVNQAKAFTTDTMHRVWMKSGCDVRSFVASYYNSISLAFAEVSGRSHGGGVLELMPNEAESILLPYKNNNAELLNFIDESLRNNRNIDEILLYTNEKILKENYGFTEYEIKIADNIRKKLSYRRIKRGKPGY